MSECSNSNGSLHTNGNSNDAPTNGTHNSNSESTSNLANLMKTGMEAGTLKTSNGSKSNGTTHFSRNESKGYLSPCSDSSDSVFSFTTNQVDQSATLNRNISSSNVLITPVSNIDSSSTEFYLDSNSTLNNNNKRSLSPTHDNNPNKNPKKIKESNFSSSAPQFHPKEPEELLDSLPASSSTNRLVNQPPLAVVKNSIRVNIGCNNKK